MRANVFIVWGGNRSLANKVSEKIQERNEFNVIVGGDNPNDIFIGEVVLRQIKMSSVAIILAQNSDKSGNDVLLRPNLMFEWGYISADFKAKNVHVFLMDMEERDLPSDLRGSWAKSIVTKGKSEDDVAKEIADIFDHDYHEQHIPAIETFENWNNIKNDIRNHTVNPLYTDREIAAIILYSFQASFYYHDIKELRELILKIKSNDSIVEKTISVVISALDYYILKEKKVHPNTGSEFNTLIRRLSGDFDLSYEDFEIDKWLHIISNNFIGLCYNRLSDLDKYNEQQKIYFLVHAKESLQKALSYLDSDKTAEKIKKENDVYSNIWRGYIYRNIGVVYAKLNDKENMENYLSRAADAREKSETYFSTNVSDTVLINNFKLENIMIQLERMKFTREIDVMDMLFIREQMELIDHELANQNTLYTNINKLLNSVEESIK